MHVVSLSLDPQVLSPESVVAARSRGYGEVLGSYTIIVPHQTSRVTELSSNVKSISSGGSNKLSQLFQVYRLVQQAVREKRCDVITSQDAYFLALVGYVLARRYHLGLEVQVLGIEKLNWLRRQLLRFTVSRASSVRLLSQSIKARLKDEFGLSHSRMHLVPIFVDVSSLGFNEALLSPEEQQILSNAKHDFQSQYGSFFNVVTVSRLVPVKNIFMQLHAAKQLIIEHPNLRWHIVGDGPLKHELENEIEKLGLKAHVILHGPKYGPELSPFFTESDCFVLTSHSEGWGMVAVEAATTGLPVVMTNVGCAGEVIKDGVSGFIVADNDVTATAKAVKTLIEDGALREKIGQAAQASVSALPDFATVRQQYVASWEAALAHKL